MNACTRWKFFLSVCKSGNKNSLYQKDTVRVFFEVGFFFTYKKSRFKPHIRVDSKVITACLEQRRDKEMKSLTLAGKSYGGVAIYV